MGHINYIQLLFAFMTSSIIALGSLINCFEDYLPTFIKQTFRYGKFAYNGKSHFLKPIQVPKAWFRHFYIFSSFLSIYALSLVLQAYIFDASPPAWIIWALDTLCGNYRSASVSSTSVLFATGLLALQCVRRLYDTHYVSVFAESSRMDLSHYIVGFLHYFGTVLAILAEAPLFTDAYGKHLKYEALNVRHISASILFMWAWWHQYKATVILGNLRRNNKGEVVSSGYKVPQGDWFDYVSTPHQLAEILMYLALTILLYGNVTWWFVFGWVLSNQVETALLSHWWYQAKFDNYPKTRKALVPFVY